MKPDPTYRHQTFRYRGTKTLAPSMALNGHEYLDAAATTQTRRLSLTPYSNHCKEVDEHNGNRTTHRRVHRPF